MVNVGHEETAMNTAAIANHLNVAESAITEIQEWARVLWVRVKGLGARFVSKKVAMSNVTFQARHAYDFSRKGVFWTPVGFVQSNGVISSEVGDLVSPGTVGLGSSDRWKTWVLDGKIMEVGDQWEMQLPKKLKVGDTYSNRQADLRVISVDQSWFDSEQESSLTNCTVELVAHNA
jgi:hypothetical protein